MNIFQMKLIWSEKKQRLQQKVIFQTFQNFGEHGCHNLQNFSWNLKNLNWTFCRRFRFFLQFLVHSKYILMGTHQILRFLVKILKMFEKKIRENVCHRIIVLVWPDSFFLEIIWLANLILGGMLEIDLLNPGPKSFH